MKNFRFKAVCQMVLLFGVIPLGATNTCYHCSCSVSNYNYHDAFAPFFYSKNGTSTRSASGQPGQNTGKTELIMF
jgi:hypothetical protein